MMKSVNRGASFSAAHPAIIGLAQFPDFRALFESAALRAVVFRPDFIIVAASDSFCQEAKIARERMCGRNLFDVFPERRGDAAAYDARDLQHSVRRVLQFRRPDSMAIQRYDIPRLASEGGGYEERYWRPLNTPVFDESGEIRWIIHQSEDVTDAIRSRNGSSEQGELVREQQYLIARLCETVQELTRKLDESADLEHDRAYLAAIVDSTNDAVVGKTLEGVVTSWNRAAERIFGYSATEIVGRDVSVLYPPELQHEEMDILGRLERGEVLSNYETVRRRKDGTDFPVSLTASPIRNAAGDVIGASKILRDVTDRKHAEERLSSVQAELIHLSRWTSIGTMASSLSHELNQPLTAIGNYLAALRRLLAAPVQDSARLGALVDKAVAQSQRMNDIITRLRKFIGKAHSERAMEDALSVVHEALELTGLSLYKAVRISVEMREPVGVVLIDKVQVQQTIINLVRNAVEAMGEDGERAIHISVGKDREGKMAQIDIADTGAGLPAAIAERLFQPFLTTKSGGMGVGLSICRQIVEAHGGRLWASANRPVGAIFSFTLPLAE